MSSKKRKDGLPRKFMYWMKKKKNKKMRNLPIDDVVLEKKFNDAKQII